MKGSKKIVIIIIGIYFFVNVFLFFSQKNMLYFPDKTSFLNCNNFIEEEKKSYQKTNFYEVKGESKNVIIFFHGNAGRACNRMGVLEILKKTGNTIILPEYFGYADSEKNNPNIEDILKDVDNMGNYLQDRKFDKVFVMGRSLGTGPASYFAKKFKTDKLLLTSAYDYLYKVGAKKYSIFPVKYLFTQNYNSLDYLKDYKSNFLLIHGKQDRVIPYNHGFDLYHNLKNKNKEILSLEYGTHHNIFGYQGVEEKIIEYFKN